jgi:hypothetical protein
MDKLRGTDSVLLKFIFGAYAFDGVLPVFRTTRSTEEEKLKKLSNILFLVFWLLFATLMVIIWIKFNSMLFILAGNTYVIHEWLIILVNTVL